MKRREILKGLLSAAGGIAAGFGLPLAHASDYRGKFFVFVQAHGGWDPTSFCDPKANTPGESVINHWAERDEIRQAGNISYAPFAKNGAFFDKYHARMLVINGVDAQTNSHTVGVVHNWSGRNSEGYPTSTALLAAHFGPGLAVPYLNFGGYSETSGIIRFTRMDNPSLLRNIAAPELVSSGSEDRYISREDWASLESYRATMADRLVATPNLLPMQARNRSYYRSALENAEGLVAYAAAIPPEEELEQVEEYDGPRTQNFIRSTLRRQAQLAILAFKTGVAVSADMWMGGFDTHANHDAEHRWLLNNLTQSVDYLWEYAEIHGVANRMLIVIGSDFGRTNFYNSDDGKDHWPIGSYVIMEKGQRWTNRVIGETDGLHFAQRINPMTLQRDDANGTIIYPKHVHKALRRYLGIENSPGAQRFPFNSTEDFAFFG